MMKIHCYNRRTKNICCSSHQGNGNSIEIEAFKKDMEKNDPDLCSKCIQKVKKLKDLIK
jgi:hypothetical protein